MALLAPALVAATVALAHAATPVAARQCQPDDCRALRPGERQELAAALITVLGSIPMPRGYTLSAATAADGTDALADVQRHAGAARLARYVPANGYASPTGAFPQDFTMSLTLRGEANAPRIEIKLELTPLPTVTFPDSQESDEQLWRRAGRVLSRLDPDLDGRGARLEVLAADDGPRGNPTTAGLAPVRMAHWVAQGPRAALLEMHLAVPQARLDGLLPRRQAAEDEQRIKMAMNRNADQFALAHPEPPPPPCNAATCRDLSREERAGLAARLRSAIAAVVAPPGFSVAKVEAASSTVDAALPDADLVAAQCYLSSRGCFPRPLVATVVLVKDGAGQVRTTVSLHDRRDGVAAPSSDGSRFLRLANTPTFAAWVVAELGKNAAGKDPGVVHAAFSVRSDPPAPAPGKVPAIAQVRVKVEGPLDEARRVYDALRRERLEALLGPVEAPR